jgi:serine/threonine protein kinase
MVPQTASEAETCSTACRHLVDTLGSLRPLDIPDVSRFASLQVEDIVCSQPPPSAPSRVQSGNDSEFCPTNDLSQVIPVEPFTKRKEPAGARQSVSPPSFIRQISHKLSTTFGNPTVVHKPSLRTRPSLQPLQEVFLFPSLVSDPGLSLGESTNPSSFNDSGSVSPGDRSTGKTSMDSNLVSALSSKFRNQNGRYSVVGRNMTMEPRIYERPLAAIKEVPAPATPTVITVESTANAKIFFETHFNSLLSGQVSSRSQRRHDLELHLQTMSFSSEQCRQERAAWVSKETEHLRRSRVLRSKTNEMCGSAGIAVAGYEVVRILGKGSFGVVRLVRAKNTGENEVRSPSSTSNISQNWMQSPREEISNLTMTAIGALKSTLDGQKAPQHHDLPNAKKEVFAMKVIRKSDMLRNSQEGHLRAERDFLVASEKSQWVVPLIASFQDANNLYLVMEYMVGGDFLSLLFRKDTLRTKKARWYIAEMILCVEEAHRLRWIHRDVKPDNFLISASGHLKISDFGLAFDGHWAHDQSYFNNHRHSLMENLGIVVDGDSIDRKEGTSIAAGMALTNILTGAKDCREKPQYDGPADNEGILEWRNRIGTRKLARSVVGTSQYMAPEVIRGDLYDGRCDWWSIGIILFEVRSPAVPPAFLH